jgi:hypothetical protein
MKLRKSQLTAIIREEMTAVTQAPRRKGGGRASLGFAIPEDSPDYGAPAPKPAKGKHGADPKKWAVDAAANLGIEIGRKIAEMDLSAAVQASVEEASFIMKHANAPQMDPWELSQAFVQQTEALVAEAMKRITQEIKAKVQDAVYDLGDGVDELVGKPKAPPGR